MARKPIGVSKAVLNETVTNELVVKGTFDYGVKKIPNKAKKDFDRLKEEGIITGSLNAYIIGSLLKRLRDDDI